PQNPDPHAQRVGGHEQARRPRDRLFRREGGKSDERAVLRRERHHARLVSKVFAREVYPAEPGIGRRGPFLLGEHPHERLEQRRRRLSARVATAVHDLSCYLNRVSMRARLSSAGTPVDPLSVGAPAPTAAPVAEAPTGVREERTRLLEVGLARARARVARRARAIEADLARIAEADELARRAQLFVAA